MDASATLTEMLRDNMGMEPECDAEVRAIEDTLSVIKTSVKQWLKSLPLPDYCEECRSLIVVLVDEP